MSTVLGVLAASWGLIMAISPLLQLRQMQQRRSSDGISIGYFGVLLVGFALWEAYGISRAELPLIVPNLVSLIVSSVTITVAIRMRHTNTPVR